MVAHAFLEHEGVLAFAHRGDHQAGPENTLSAFEGAVQQGFCYLETDVHCSKDGVLLAFHDDRLDRVTDRQGLIAQTDYATIRQARIRETEQIPRLESLLEAFPDTRFNIDPKSDAAVGPLIDVIHHMDAGHRVCIGSFYGRRLRWVRESLPRVCTSMARAETTYARFASLGLPWRGGGAACAQVPVWWNRILVVDHRFVQTMHARGIPVHVWTVNNVDEMHRLLDLGVDGLMTDYPAKLKSVLLTRGQWHQPC